MIDDRREDRAVDDAMPTVRVSVEDKLDYPDWLSKPAPAYAEKARAQRATDSPGPRPDAPSP